MFLKLGVYSLIFGLILSLGLPVTATAFLQARPEGQAIRSSQDTGRFYLQTRPGETLQQSVRLFNTSNSDQSVVLASTNLQPDDNGILTPNPDPLDPQINPANWLKFSDQPFAIPTNGSTAIPFELQIPESTANGEYIAGLVISPISAVNNNQNPVQVVKEQVLRLYILIGDSQTQTVKAEVQSMQILAQPDTQADRPYVGRNNPAVQLQIRNQSSVVTLVTGTLSQQNPQTNREIPVEFELYPHDKTLQTYVFLTGVPLNPGQNDFTFKYQVQPKHPNLAQSNLVNPTEFQTLSFSYSLSTQEWQNLPQSQIQATSTTPPTPNGLNPTPQTPNRQEYFILGALLILILLILIYYTQRVKLERYWKTNPKVLTLRRKIRDSLKNRSKK